MDCREVRRLLLDYLEGELGASEAEMVRAHLEVCPVCRREADALWVAREKLVRGLKALGEGATPPAGAWERLRRRLEREPAGVPSRSSRLRSLKGAAVAVFISLLLAIVTVAAVPSFRARVGEALRVWFRLERREFAIEIFGTRPEFTPLQPAYLPPGLSGAGGTMSTPKGLLVFFGDPNGKWLLVEEGAVTAPAEPVEGRRVRLGDKEVTILVTSGSTTIPVFDRRPVELRRLTYENATMLVCEVGDVRVKLLSNLPEEELLKVAASLRPLEGR